MTIKLSPEDPFRNSITASQFFEIDSRQDNIIEGKNGTIVVCPKGSFIDSDGEMIESTIKLELSESLTLEEMLLSNLTTTSDGKQLVTDGMIFLNASFEGKQVRINKNIPVYIEIPTMERKAGMMAYKGIRDKEGNMNWVDPKELNNQLIIVDINSLDFLPPGFQAEVNKGMPYKTYQTATQSLTDSLYYQLSVTDGSFILNGLITTKLNEPFDNKNAQIINGNYDSKSYSSESNIYPENLNDSTGNCGIDPAIIKVLKTEKYQNTFIATREFEARLKIIFKTCNNKILETYITNIDKNLYEADSLAAIASGASEFRNDFINFSQQRRTKVKDADKYAKLLKGHYKNQLAKVKLQLENENEKLKKELSKKNVDANKIKENYVKILRKREKYRMETYGFTWTETGWVNVDNGTEPKSWDSKRTEGIIVKNGKDFERVYSYLVFTSMRSIYRLNTNDNIEFYAGNNEDKSILMPKKGSAILVSIGYKSETPYLAIKEIDLSQPLKQDLTLIKTTPNQAKELIGTYDKYAKENQINADLEFMASFYKEEQRQNKLLKESEFIHKLWKVAFSCCNDYQSGENLFNTNCAPCHRQDEYNLIGPGLAFSTSKYSAKWLYEWTINSKLLINSGDKDAIRIYQQYNMLAQPSFKLTEQEVASIFSYIDNYNRNN